MAALQKQVAAEQDAPPASASTPAHPTAAPAESAIDATRNAAGGPTLAASLGALMTVIGFLIGARVISDNSFFTHLATGRLILEDGAVPTADPYSFTAAGEGWVVQSWLVSLIYAAMDSVLGAVGIRAFHGALGAGITWTVWKLTDRSDSVFVRLGCTGTVLIVGASLWSPRPLMVGLLGFAVLLAVLDKRLPLPYLLPIMWIWANSHGSFPLAGVVSGAVALGAYFDTKQWRSFEAQAFGWVTAGTALAVANPLGIKILTFPVQLLRNREPLENVKEWAPLTLASPWGIMLVPLLIGLAVAVNKGARWKLVLPAAAFVAAAFLAVRNVNVAVILLAVGIAPWLDLNVSSLSGDERSRFSRMIAVAAGCFALIVGFSLLTPGVDLSDYPVDELELLDRQGRVGDTSIPLITPETVGNYMTLTHGADAAVFADDRFDMYPVEVTNDLETLIFGGDYRAVLDRYDAQTVLWYSNSGFEFWLDEAPEWDLDETDSADSADWLIARRVTPSPEALASAP